MIFEMRTYKLRPGKTAQYLNVYGDMALELQLKHQKNLVGFWQTEFGALNRTVNIWAYDSVEARNEAKAALGQEPGWKKYLEAAQPLLEDQESLILKPAPFFNYKP